jgi:hypothetical protein
MLWWLALASGKKLPSLRLGSLRPFSVAYILIHQAVFFSFLLFTSRVTYTTAKIKMITLPYPIQQDHVGMAFRSAAYLIDVGLFFVEPESDTHIRCTAVNKVQFLPVS